MVKRNKIVITDVTGNEVKFLKEYSIDIDIAKTMDFEMIIKMSSYNNDYAYWTRVFVPNTEYGGYIGGREIQTFGEEVKLTGRTWRGVLNKHILSPNAGEDYKKISGELNTVIRQLIQEAGIASLFVVPDIDTGVNVTNFQFKRYTTLYKGVVDMLESVGYRLNVVYRQQEEGDVGYVELQALEIEDYSNTIELSQNSKINFSIKENVDGINHLICLGQGELKDRQVIHLYLQEDGTIGSTQYYFGINEIAEIYDYSSVESIEDLQKYGVDRFKEVASKQSLEASVEELGLDIAVGDIIGGRDYVTGAYLAKPITNKIYKSTNDVYSIEYSIEGEETEPEVQ